jgi:hypothetical protein
MGSPFTHLLHTSILLDAFKGWALLGHFESSTTWKQGNLEAWATWGQGILEAGQLGSRATWKQGNLEASRKTWGQGILEARILVIRTTWGQSNFGLGGNFGVTSG